MIKNSELLENDKKIMLYKCKIKEIDNKIVENWDKNNPINNEKILEIYKSYITNNTKIIPGIIYGWEKENKLYIYDGIKRILAAQKTNNNMTFILQTIQTNEEKDIINDFLKLNKNLYKKEEKKLKWFL